MDKEQKTLKSPLSAILDSNDRAKVQAAVEAQKSLAREVLSLIKIKATMTKIEDLMKEIIK